jgi:hypothetical protein
MLAPPFKKRQTRGTTAFQKRKMAHNRLTVSHVCRDDWIRTSDPLHPMQVRYRAALRPVNSGFEEGKGRETYGCFKPLAASFSGATFFPEVYIV